VSSAQTWPGRRSGEPATGGRKAKLSASGPSAATLRFRGSADLVRRRPSLDTKGAPATEAGALVWVRREGAGKFVEA